MVLLQPDPFLNELTSMYERSTEKGSVWVTLKRSSMKSKVKRNKMTTAGDVIEYRCLVRATDAGGGKGFIDERGKGLSRVSDEEDEAGGGKGFIDERGKGLSRVSDEEDEAGGGDGSSSRVFDISDSIDESETDFDGLVIDLLLTVDEIFGKRRENHHSAIDSELLGE
ncbi:hypothetical protein HHK36_013287 [Tetracentron sinense]|uniref:Signal recognition particle 14 kDa protein n=1 Tax=Tetracentron sinense TaxID=13715 RepID=A0A835DF92_TETSI|nr:hypothetical protein HHK36_013287 [Tetracentron sinense]